MKRILRGRFIALKAYIRKDERSEVNNLSFYIRKLGKKKNNLTLKQVEEKRYLKFMLQSMKLKKHNRENK